MWVETLYEENLFDNTVFIRYNRLGRLYNILDLESGRLFEVGAYSRLGAY